MKTGALIVTVIAALVLNVVLLSALFWGCPGWFDPLHPPRDYEHTGIQPGQLMPAVMLESLDRQPIAGASLWQDRPVVIMTASITCPLARKHLAGLQRLAQKYGDRASFQIVYLIEAHPNDSASPYSDDVWVTDVNVEKGILYPQPSTAEQRMQLATVFSRLPECDVPVCVDKMDNRFWSAIGRASNVGLIVGAGGEILARTGWFDEARLAAVLEKLPVLKR